MFVFGINLPVAEILFVVLLLFIAALVIIIVQLTKMTKNIRVLDETTLEIRRYEGAEEVTLRAIESDARELKPNEKKRAIELQKAAMKVETRAMKELLVGSEPSHVRNTLVAAGMPEHLATRAVNNATYLLDRTMSLETAEARRVSDSLKSAAKK